MINDFKYLINELLKEKKETEWIEFKHNNPLFDDIGEYISALSNSAALLRRPYAYLIWGIDDDRNIVGTTFNFATTKNGNEELESWVTRLLKPRINLKYDHCEIDGKTIGILTIPAAHNEPVQFKNKKFIRIGSYKKAMSEYPEKEKALWSILSRHSFEDDVALDGLEYEEALNLLNYNKYYKMLNIPLPEEKKNFLNNFISEKFILKNDDGSYAITNLGALLFANDLNQFEHLKRKAIRIIQYKGKDRTETISEQSGIKGYVAGFEGMIRYINTILPKNEIIEQALRKQLPVYPEIAIRELVANALVHQDLSLSGTSPMVEIFSDRIEITNPGTPLIDTLRFMDEPPQTRNEQLCAFMRRVGICEERGSGIDKVIKSVEIYQLPAPDFKKKTNHTLSIMFAPKPFSKMDKEDRIRACYQHASLLLLSNERMTNSSLRKRFGLADKSYTIVSKILKDTLAAKLIKTADQSSDSKKDIKYIPFWG